MTNDNKPLLGRIIIKGSHKSKSSLIDIPWHVDTNSIKCLGQATGMNDKLSMDRSRE